MVQSCRFEHPSMKFTISQTDATDDLEPLDCVHTCHPCLNRQGLTRRCSFTGTIEPGDDFRTVFMLTRLSGPRCPGGDLNVPGDNIHKRGPREWCADGMPLKGKIRFNPESQQLEVLVVSVESAFAGVNEYPETWSDQQENVFYMCLEKEDEET